jgi:hypothetical protein
VELVPPKFYVPADRSEEWMVPRLAPNSQPVSHVWVLRTVSSTHHCTRPPCGVAAAHAANRS